ncbi:MAG: H-type lectin domain-containing protein, partial [Verrucomicrobiota bacterium]
MFQEKSLSLLIGLLFLALSPSLASESLQLEVQSVSTNTSGRGDWEAVQFDTEFSEVPVVVASPPAYGGNQPVSIAIRNVTTLGFEFQVREWEYLDGSHNEETVSFLALEPGVHQFGDKTIIAGRSQASTSDPAGGVPVDFSLSMIDPVVLAQIEFVTAELTATPRVSAIDSNGFSLQLQLEEAVHGSVSFDCMVSWIAAETGTASVDGVNLMVGSESVSSDWKEIDFGINAPTPYFFGEMQSVNEPDTATLRIRNLSEISVSVKVEEEASLDEEVDHGDESIGFFVLWKDLSPKLEIGEIEVSVLGDGAWWRVELNYSYDNPVVIIGPPTASLEEPIITSIRNVEPDSFEVRLHPWDYQSDRQHPLEKISFLVMESGVYSLGGLTWEAGHSEAGSSQFTTQSFRSVEFQESPVVVTALESEFADGAAISRIRNVTEGSFQLRLYEEQGADGLRPLETVHYLAVSEGAAELFDGAVVRVETHLDVDSDWNTAQFSSWLDEGFYIGAFQTVNGADPGALRIKNLLPNQVDARFEEERSADDEVSHVGEALGSIYFGVPQVSMEEGVDFDADGLTNRDEILNLGTNPKLSDTDGDGLSDSVEVAGLSDARRSDTDGDGLGDAWELNHGFDVNAAETGIHASYADADGDGWTNAHEAEREMDPFSADEVRGFWIREHWENIRLYSTFLLVKDSRFFAPPSEIVPQVGSSTGEIFKSNFANRIRGYIEAPETGEYQFWISGKTAAELWLSTDDSKFNKRLIARLGPEFGSGHGVGINHNFKWNAFVSQQSVMISLQAGERYFIEVLQQHGHTKEAHASVAWARPGGERESIPGDFIISYAHVDTDQDDDSLPDDWEQAFGLNSFDDGRSDRGREGQWGDFDSDGLSNHDEYILQLNPAVDDSQTYLESISNSANRIELGDSLIESFPGALVLGEGWTLMSDDSIQAEYRRARRTFDLDIAQPGHYKAQLLIGDVAQADGIRNTAVKLFLNGVFLGRYGVLLPVE